MSAQGHLQTLGDLVSDVRFRALSRRPGNAPWALPCGTGRDLVLGFIHQAAFGDPGHHGAEFFADGFQLMAGGAFAHGLEARLIGVQQRVRSQAESGPISG